MPTILLSNLSRSLSLIFNILLLHFRDQIYLCLTYQICLSPRLVFHTRAIPVLLSTNLDTLPIAKCHSLNPKQIYHKKNNPILPATIEAKYHHNPTNLFQIKFKEKSENTQNNFLFKIN